MKMLKKWKFRIQQRKILEDEGAVTEDSAASESEVDSVTDVDLFSDADSEEAVAESKQFKRCTDCRSKTGVRLWERLSEASFF